MKTLAHEFDQCSEAACMNDVMFLLQMAEEGHPPLPVQKRVSIDTYKWPNRKEDYELLDVIGDRLGSKTVHCYV